MKSKPNKGCSGSQVVHLLQDLDLVFAYDPHELEEAQLPSVKFQDLKRVEKSVYSFISGRPKMTSLC